jgi:predicted transcriptional regulator
MTVATGLSVAPGLALAASSRLRRWLTGILVSLFHRIRDHELLENPTRKTLYETIRAEPGIHYEALRKAEDLSRGTLEHHLDRMLEADLLVEERVHGYRSFFLAGHVPSEERTALALIRSEGARLLAAHLEPDTGSGLRELARAAGLAASTASHHLDKFQDAGIVRDEGDDGGRAFVLTSLGKRVLDRLGSDSR